MPRHLIGHQSFKGRGSSSNVAGRFDSLILEKTDDGWYQDEIVENPTETVLPDRARSVITSNDSPDVGFEVSINPYRGCAHGCIYCFARPTHSYLGLSPGLDFETKLFYKADAVKILEAELAKPKYVCKTIALGINTDGYQPLEKRLEVTRGILAVLARCRHPVTIVTKSALIIRDLDLLADLAKDHLVSVMVSVTSLTNDIKRTLEPRTASPAARLRVIEQLAGAGVPVGVLVAPVIPAITDHEIEDILGAAKAAGATRAGYVLLRLPHELKLIFREWLAEHYPDRAKHVMSLIKQSRGGKDYDSQFGTRMRGTGPYAELLRTRFDLAKRKLGFASAEERYELNTKLFRPPTPATPQLSLGF
jgi:DNA repair photolyase